MDNEQFAGNTVINWCLDWLLLADIGFPSYFKMRYFNSEGSKRICSYCRESGHTMRQCPQLMIRCNICNQEHDPTKCPDGDLCFRCGNMGHMSKDCVGRINKNCTYCGVATHIHFVGWDDYTFVKWDLRFRLSLLGMSVGLASICIQRRAWEWPSSRFLLLLWWLRSSRRCELNSGCLHLFCFLLQSLTLSPLQHCPNLPRRPLWKVTAYNDGAKTLPAWLIEEREEKRRKVGRSRNGDRSQLVQQQQTQPAIGNNKDTHHATYKRKRARSPSPPPPPRRVNHHQQQHHHQPPQQHHHHRVRPTNPIHQQHYHQQHSQVHHHNHLHQQQQRQQPPRHYHPHNQNEHQQHIFPRNNINTHTPPTYHVQKRERVDHENNNQKPPSFSYDSASSSTRPSFRQHWFLMSILN